MKVKFKNMPLGGRFLIGDSVYIVINKDGCGLVAREVLDPSDATWQSLCCFVDDETTLDSEVNFIGLEDVRK